MSKNELLQKILIGNSDKTIQFSGLCRLLLEMGFKERIKGSHHIFTKEGIQEIINIQPKGSMAKPYQVEQVRGLILKYKLSGENDEQV